MAWGFGAPPIPADVEGTVKSWSPATHEVGHSFAFTFLDEPASVARWRITAMGAVSQVRLGHDLSGRPATAEIVGHSWPVMVARLKTFVETGHVMPEPVWPADP